MISPSSNIYKNWLQYETTVEKAIENISVELRSNVTPANSHLEKHPFDFLSTTFLWHEHFDRGTPWNDTLRHQ